MPMTKQLWSINALATELGRDRRTIAKALRAVPPDGKSSRGDRQWHLQTVLDALGIDARRGQDWVPMPLGFEALEQIKDPLDQGVLTAFLSLAYGIGPLVASLAVGAGASMRVAYALHNMMTLACAIEADGFYAGVVQGVKEDGNAIFNLAALQRTNWEALAEMAGEPVDMEAWQEWSRQRGTSLAESQ